jgi:hypothetical protein
MTQVNSVDITAAEEQQNDNNASSGEYHSSYNTTSLKHKHMDMICLQVSWWVTMHCKKSVVHD